MKARILFTGKTEDTRIKSLIGEYIQRIGRYLPVEVVEIPALKNAASLSSAEQCRKESIQIRNLLTPGDYVVLLDEHGTGMESRAFAEFLERRFLTGGKNIVFIIGGPFGFDPALKKEAGFLLSLSRMTFPHQLVRVFLVEQLYRALTILRGESYHHD